MKYLDSTIAEYPDIINLINKKSGEIWGGEIWGHYMSFFQPPFRSIKIAHQSNNLYGVPRITVVTAL